MSNINQREILKALGRLGIQTDWPDQWFVPVAMGIAREAEAKTGMPIVRANMPGMVNPMVGQMFGQTSSMMPDGFERKMRLGAQTIDQLLMYIQAGLIDAQPLAELLLTTQAAHVVSSTNQGVIATLKANGGPLAWAIDKVEKNPMLALGGAALAAGGAYVASNILGNNQGTAGQYGTAVAGGNNVMDPNLRAMAQDLEQFKNNLLSKFNEGVDKLVAATGGAKTKTNNSSSGNGGEAWRNDPTSNRYRQMMKEKAAGVWGLDDQTFQAASRLAIMDATMTIPPEETFPEGSEGRKFSALLHTLANEDEQFAGGPIYLLRTIKGYGEPFFAWAYQQMTGTAPGYQETPTLREDPGE